MPSGAGRCAAKIRRITSDLLDREIEKEFPVSFACRLKDGNGNTLATLEHENMVNF